MHPEKTPLTIGLDLGDRRHTFCVLDSHGDILAEDTVTNDHQGLATFSARFPRATIAMETGTHSPWVSRLFQSRGHKVYVANARKLCAISQNQTKTDRHDARMLARLCRADPRLLSPITHRSEACQRAMLKLKVRETLVRSRVAQTNAIRFLLKSLDLELERMATDDYPVTTRLRQIPGVGPLTALAFVLTIESPQRFDETRTVGAYLGLVPKRDQSAQTDRQLRITKAGNTQLRCLLVNCAHYSLGPFGPDTALRQHGLHLATRGAAAAKKRAVIATARKFSVPMLALWKTGRNYQPNPQPLAACPPFPQGPVCPIQATAITAPA